MSFEFDFIAQATHTDASSFARPITAAVNAVAQA
jgi:hypothetical protein